MLSEGNTAGLPEQNTKQNAELPAQPSTVTAVPPERRLKPENNAAVDTPEKDSDPMMAPIVHEKPFSPAGISLPEQHSKSPDQTVRMAQETGVQPSLPGAQPSSDAPVLRVVEPSGTVMAPIEREVHISAPVSAGPAGKMDRTTSPPGNGQTPQVGSRFTNAQQPRGVCRSGQNTSPGRLWRFIRSQGRPVRI